MKKLRWGVLSTAKIGLNKVLPAMMRSELCSVDAIASRELGKAQEAATKLGIARAYGSYEELLAVEQRTGVKIGEAFMVDCHPQWVRVRELLRGGRIGELRAMVGYFSYYNVDPKNIRNQVEAGGGALMDIGCYMVHAARWGFGAEPVRVSGVVERDPVMGTDRLTSGMMQFAGGQAVFVCSTQLAPFQRVEYFGTKGRITVEVPVNAPNDRPTRVVIDSGADLFAGGAEVETFGVCDQYTLQGDAFARAVLEGGEVPVTVANAVGNMRVIEAIFRNGA